MGPVALIIGLLCLRWFALFRSWKFLFLSVAFLILSVTPLLQFLGYLNLFASSLGPVLGILDSQAMKYLIPTIAFLLLAMVYSDELRMLAIKVSKNSWILFGTLVIAYPVSAFLALTYADQSQSILQERIVSFAPQVIDGWICYTLVLIAIFAL